MPLNINNLYGYYQLYHHMTRACNKDPLLCLHFNLAATALLLCFVKPCIVLDFSNVFKEETNVLSLLTIFKFCLWFTLGNIFTSFSAVYTRYSSVNICSILQAYIFRTFKICFKWNAPAIAIYQQFYNVTNLSLDMFSDFKDICCVCYSNSSAKICCVLMDFVPVFHSLPMNFHKIPYQTQKSPQFSKTYIA